LHLFDVQRHKYVLKEWRKLEGQTRVAKEQHAHKKEKVGEKIAFGETSPLSKNAPRRSGTLKGKQQEEHAKRWASYSKDMSFDAFVRGQSELEKSSNDEQSTESKPSPAATNITENDITHTTATTSNRLDAQCGAGYSTERTIPNYSKSNLRAWEESSHLETLGLSPEELRLQSYDSVANVFAPGRDQVKRSAVQVSPMPAQQQRYTPLLELFQEQLAKLGTDTSEKAVNTAAIPQASLSDLTKAKPLQLATALAKGFPGAIAAKPTATHTPLVEVVQTPTAPRPVTPRLPLPEESLADSLKLIMSGVAQISAALQQTRAELHATLGLARQDFPRGIQDAIKAGTAAIDALRGGPTQPTTQSASTTTAAEASRTSELIENHTPIQEKVENWTPECIVNRRRIIYDGDPEVGQTEVTEYLVRYSGHDSPDDAWCKKDQISVPGLIVDFEDHLRLKRQQAEERKLPGSKDGNKAKLGLSAYMFFANDRRDKFLAENPNMRFGMMASLISLTKANTI